MLKTEVDIMTKTEHPNVYAPLPRARTKPPTRRLFTPASVRRPSAPVA